MESRGKALIGIAVSSEDLEQNLSLSSGERIGRQFKRADQRIPQDLRFDTRKPFSFKDLPMSVNLEANTMDSGIIRMLEEELMTRCYLVSNFSLQYHP